MTTPTSRNVDPHIDVAAYALGLLTDPEMDEFEAHLAECEQCGAQLESLVETGQLLAQADVTVAEPDPVTVVEPQAVVTKGDDALHRLVGEVARQRTVRRRQLSFALAAGIVLIALAAAAGFWLAPTDSSDQPAHHAQTPSGQLLLTGDRYRATDSTSEVAAVVALEDKKWGTHVGLELKNVHGPLTCQLVAVTKQGAAIEAMTWNVGERGWGTKENPEPLTLHTALATNRDSIDHFEVRTSTGTTLVSVPIAG